MEKTPKLGKVPNKKIHPALEGQIVIRPSLYPLIPTCIMFVTVGSRHIDVTIILKATTILLLTDYIVTTRMHCI